ncbi:hypothetical protein L209DRAFT_434187 [Thermothelomyces heterothallicus CBS 203.75]
MTCMSGPVVQRQRETLFWLCSLARIPAVSGRREEKNFFLFASASSSFRPFRQRGTEENFFSLFSFNGRDCHMRNDHER